MRRAVDRLLGRCLPDDVRGRAIRGDLLEERARVARRRGRVLGDLWYIAQAVAVGSRYLAVRGWARASHVVGADLPGALRGAARVLVRRPVASSVVVVTLALGTGATAAVLSIVDGVLLRPLPYPEPRELVRIWSARENPPERFLDLSHPEFRTLSREVRSMESMAAYSLAPRTLADDRADPVSGTVARVSAGFFGVLDPELPLGRAFSAGEEARSDRVVILGHGFWRSRYGGSPEALGATVVVEGEPHTVVGVAPPGIAHPAEVDLWRPLSPREREDEDRELAVLGRLAPGASVARASEELAGLAGALGLADRRGEALTLWAQPLAGSVVRDVRAPILALLGGVLGLLLLAAINVTGVLLARAVERERETAVRVALGAGRAALVRDSVLEATLLAGAGGVAGLVLGHVGLEALISLLPPDVPRSGDLRLDGRVFLATGGLVLLVGLVSGLVPGLRVGRVDPGEPLRSSGRTGDAPRSRRVRDGLVIAQVALSASLVGAAGLLALTLVTLTDVDRGVLAPDRVLAVYVNPPLAGEERAEALPAALAELEAAVVAVPGVEAVAFSTHHPASHRGFDTPVAVEGRPLDLDRAAHLRVVTPGYVSVLGTPILAGSDPSVSAAARDPAAAVVNRAFAREVLGSTPSGAVGREVTLTRLDLRVRVVGVAGDVVLDARRPPPPKIFVADPSLVFAGMEMLVRIGRTEAEVAPLLRAAVRRLQPEVPLDELAPLQTSVRAGLASTRRHLALSALLGVVSLALAGIGVYGVVAESVSRRTREIGLRRALGASRAQVGRLVGRQVAGLLLPGLVLGYIGTWGVHRVLASLLHGVGPAHPALLLTVTAALALTGAAAGVVPALRAGSVEPAEALSGD